MSPWLTVQKWEGGAGGVLQCACMDYCFIKTLRVLKPIVWRWDYSPGIFAAVVSLIITSVHCNWHQTSMQWTMGSITTWIILSTIDTLGFALGLFKSNNHKILGVYLVLKIISQPFLFAEMDSLPDLKQDLVWPATWPLLPVSKRRNVFCCGKIQFINNQKKKSFCGWVLKYHLTQQGLPASAGLEVLTPKWLTINAATVGEMRVVHSC